VSWREELKASVERGVVSSGLATASRRHRRRGALILAYHNVVPEGVEIGGESSLHLPVAQFAAQLDALMETHEVVPLASVLDPLPPAAARPRVVVTIDDAYRGAVTVGVPELVRRGIPATIFVAPAFVGGRTFWWDALTPPSAPGPTAEFRSRALEECRGADAAVREWAERGGHRVRPLPDHAACASEGELRAAASQPGITLAPHSWSHPNLPRLEGSQLEEELTRPLAWLGARFRSMLPVLSYPYGLCSTRVQRAAAAAGYRAAVVIGGGWISPGRSDPFALPRLNIPAGLSRNGFLLRTAGLFVR
jgi:peptidoglycan/xylan/chitin deacetylase (PgdA/CDA1 family)